MNQTVLWIKKNISIILTLLIFFMLPFHWYHSLMPIGDFGTPPSYNGFEVLQLDSGHCFIIFCLYAVIQYLVVQNKKYALLGIISQIFLLYTIFYFPMTIYRLDINQIRDLSKSSDFFIWKNYLIPSFSWALYIVFFIILISILENIKTILQHTNLKGFRKSEP